MDSAADIIDMAKNGFLDRPTPKEEISETKTSMFNDFPEGLQIPSHMCAVQEAPATRQSNTNDKDGKPNTNAMDRQSNAKE